MDYFNILIPVIGIFANIAAQIFSYKYLLGKKLLRSEYFGFLYGSIALVVCTIPSYQALEADWLSLICVNLIIYLCFSYCYFNFINMGETARRIRLLRELDEAPAGLTQEEMLKRYNAQEIINIRMSRLIHNGQVLLRDGRYYVGSPVMLLISKAIVLMKLIVLGKKSEFDLHHE
ncbi:MAG: hypothetical protein WC616_04720 [Candidatus Omnitrophota bacterium]